MSTLGGGYIAVADCGCRWSPRELHVGVGALLTRIPAWIYPLPASFRGLVHA